MPAVWNAEHAALPVWKELFIGFIPGGSLGFSTGTVDVCAEPLLFPVLLRKRVKAFPFILSVHCDVPENISSNK